ncbi:alpha-ketoglutarate-dependent dioxygenase AlkB [Halomonas sp. MCCC 1A17488]|uniref:alpha-ketoglutarate-dependent dioxygenase AlkB family protein n=1 Tax=unclassified Halomonas TaxID=2609666 RepID=UPI0018D1F8D7|nr:MULTISPECIES: alpha-ketoglutarate-dependent dioxygenase AlkB [unclassified Halomonas]MCE8015070.1 alpha-ketoglutarate-dependent dioxygenase AlkB [Halomonas sp. MCCC 1A17488]MCG3238403.1 alpha-ketoglutarate-dependent dioxygenase AlkB [Halomonas sp. MCCC 1A17488]QPP47854.1 alpha-ketoglutarate-dependent dioxygenase AlkB [Halomonas sp. SS10-MC5]
MATPAWERCLPAPPLYRYRGVLGEPAASEVLARLEAELDWQQPRLRLYGREHPIPRRQVWMGDPEAHYRYSGRDFVPLAWHPDVVAIRERIAALLAKLGLDIAFNSVLLNRYADGDERMGWHSDDEPELGDNPVIAAVTLGSERPLRFRWKQGGDPPFNVWLPHDSLLLMGPGCQAKLQHALLPRRVPGLRISLTFRRVLIRPRRRR